MNAFEHPGGSPEVIVGVSFGGKFTWLVSEKEMWFLDAMKLGNDFKKLGYSPGAGGEERFGIEVLDRSTARTFLDASTAFQHPVRDLREWFRALLPLSDWENDGFYFPSLLVDFDGERLFSIYSEGTPFEDYVPSGWEGIWGEFFHLVPEEQRYWVIDGVDHWMRILGRE